MKLSEASKIKLTTEQKSGAAFAAISAAERFRRELRTLPASPEPEEVENKILEFLDELLGTADSSMFSQVTAEYLTARLFLTTTGASESVEMQAGERFRDLLRALLRVKASHQ